MLKPVLNLGSFSFENCAQEAIAIDNAIIRNKNFFIWSKFTLFNATISDLVSYKSINTLILLFKDASWIKSSQSDFNKKTIDLNWQHWKLFADPDSDSKYHIG